MEFFFIYVNKMEDDVLLKYIFDCFECEYKGWFKVYYMIFKEMWVVDRKIGSEWSSDRVTYGRISLFII